jgi:hypothetical protein
VRKTGDEIPGVLSVSEETTPLKKYRRAKARRQIHKYQPQD